MSMERPPHPLIEQARGLLNQGQAESALAAARRRLAEAAADVDALEIVALVHQRRGQAVEAIAVLETIIALAPSLDWPRDDLAILLAGLGRGAEAEVAVRATLALNANNPQAHAMLGTLLTQRRDLPGGEASFRRALALAGEHPPTQVALAANLIEQGKLEAAEPLLARADQLAPRDGQTLAHWSRLRDAMGDLPASRALLDRAEAAGFDVTLRRAVQLGREKRHAEALAVIEAVPGQPGGDALLERGRLKEKLDRPAEAFADFVAGKARLAARDGFAYDGAAVTREFDALARLVEARGLPPGAARREGPQPVFVFGFPRSGTTMVEQILSSHSAIAAGGELQFVTEMVSALEGALGGLPALWEPGVSETLRDLYLDRAGAFGLMDGGQPVFTDKMPLSEVWTPVIRAAFPEARLIRMVRHPLDTAVSMLSHNLTHGEFCGYRIEDIASHMLAVHALTGRYRAALGDTALAVRYEDLVADQEDWTRRLLAHLDLPFEAACLRFHENRRYAPTPSYAQVSEPLNDRSIGRWRQYAEQLAPQAAALAGVIADLGYAAPRAVEGSGRQ
ncbi:sulfotransferase [Caulobacter sp.]|uniref:tetratricopeptide repeat-containing sulfotransferase family protein n=1 Tax=Caulobacter sp. TaxID=78 RepID=UPI003BA91B8A